MSSFPAGASAIATSSSVLEGLPDDRSAREAEYFRICNSNSSLFTRFADFSPTPNIVAGAIVTSVVNNTLTAGQLPGPGDKANWFFSGAWTIDLYMFWSLPLAHCNEVALKCTKLLFVMLQHMHRCAGDNNCVGQSAWGCSLKSTPFVEGHSVVAHTHTCRASFLVGIWALFHKMCIRLVCTTKDTLLL